MGTEMDIGPTAERQQSSYLPAGLRVIATAFVAIALDLIYAIEGDLWDLHSRE